MSVQAPELIWGPARNPSGLTELEVVSGMVLGQGAAEARRTDRRSTSRTRPDPMDVLRRIARQALSTPPCVVAFSGGRDSSALLAVLADEARREGLSAPVAVTTRWDDDEASDETSWQEHVVRTVGVADWEIVRPGTDLDLLGPVATCALQDYGLMWPPPAYALQPMIRLAAGGAFVSGEGGDEAFELWPYARFWSAVRRHRLPARSDVRAFGLGCAPRAYRRRRWRRDLPPYQDWLRPEAFRRVAEALADDQADDPLRWDHYQRVSRGRRAVGLTVDTLQRLCGDVGSRFVAPFLDHGFLASLGAWGGPLGPGDRTEAMTALFCDLLPNAVLSRTSKASFGGVFWGPMSRQFAREWDGSGLSSDLVDHGSLRRAWLMPVPVYAAALPLHASWLSSRGEWPKSS